MPIVKLNIKPGFDGQSTATANESGWFSGNLMRWRLGLLEKLAGWQRLFNAQVSGLVRSMNAWLDLSNDKRLLMAGDGFVSLLLNDNFEGVIPFSGATLDTSQIVFSVTAGTTAVTITAPGGNPLVSADNFLVGDTFVFQMQMSIGGIHFAAGDGVVVTVVTSGTSIGFDLPVNALVTDTNARDWPVFIFGWASSNAAVHFRQHGLVFGNTFLVDQTTDIVGVDFEVVIPAGTLLTVTGVSSVDVFLFDWTFFLVSGSGGTPGTPATVNEGDTFYYPDTGAVLFGPVIASLRRNAISGQVDWFTANLGEVGLVNVTGAPLFSLAANDFALRPVGTADSSAPQINNGMLIAMPQAQVIMLGSETVFGTGQQDPLLIRWSDAGTFDVWTADVANQAGSFRLGRGSKIIGGLQAPQTTLIWTDTDVWSMSYIGPPLVYGFTLMASGCGLIAAHAAVTIGGTTIWASRQAFWQFSGGGVTPLPCPQWDFIFRDMNTAEILKVHMGASTSTNEAYCFFPSLADAATVNPIYNFLAFSQTFSNVAWAPIGIMSIVDGVTAPDGTTTAELLVEDNTMGRHGLEQTVHNQITSSKATLSLYASDTSTRNLEIALSGPKGHGVFAQFDSSVGTVIDSGASGLFSIVSVSSTTDSIATGPGGNGWLRYILTFIANAALNFNINIGGIDGTNSDFYTGDGVSGIVIWGAQLNLGNVLPYQSTSSLVSSTNEPTRYVKYNVAEGLWDSGKWPNNNARTAWIDENIFGPPLGADINARIQQHETGFDDDGQPMFGVQATTGYADLGDGDDMMSVSKCIPDFKWFGINGGIDLTLMATSYPNGKVITYGPFSITSDTQWFNPRLRARQVSMQFSWRAELGFSARLGATRFEIKPTGKHP